MTPATRQRTPNQRTSVPFTRESLDALEALAVRFTELQRPITDHAIIEIALKRLYNEYCLFDKGVHPSDPKSVRLIKKNSMQVLNARWQEYVNEQTFRRKRTA